MALNLIPTGQRFSIADGVDYINNAISAADKAENNSNQAMSIAKNASRTADKSKQQSQITSDQLDNVIIESGTSDAEVLQARVNNRGTAFNVLNDRLDDLDIEFKERGVNVKWFGASGSVLETTGSIKAGSNQLTVANRQDFNVGQGILIKGAGMGGIVEVAELQVTTGATVDGNVLITLDGIATSIAVLAGDTAIQIADKVRAATFVGWTTGGSAGTDTVTFTSEDAGEKQDATYNQNGTGALGTMSTMTEGTNGDELITEVTAIDGVTFTLADVASTDVKSTITKHDDTIAIQSSFESVASFGGGTVYIPGRGYNISSTLKYYPDKISLVSDEDAEFIFTQTAGYGMEITAYERLDVKDYLSQAFKRSVEGITFRATNRDIFLIRSIGDSPGQVYAAGWKFIDCSFLDANIIELNSCTWATLFDKCYFKPLQTNYGIYMPDGGTNYGEKISVSGSVFDFYGTAIYNNNGEGDIRVVNSSIDYGITAIKVNSGLVSLDNVFVEQNTDSHWFEVDGYGAHLDIGKIQIVDTFEGDRTKEYFRVEESTNELIGAGLTADSLKLTLADVTSAGSITPFLVKGTGRTLINRVDSYKDARKPVISRFLNELAFGDCNTEASINEWDSHRFSATKPSLDSTESKEGSASMKFTVPTEGYSSGAQIQFNCEAGEMIRFKYHIKTKNLESNGKDFKIERRFLNRKGDAISTGGVETISSDYYSWTERFVVPTIEAPPGTTTVEISFWGGAWSTDVAVWLDDLVINII
ncbi:alanine-zipper protein [Halobacillus ihumii]|uniref:alanine-zipper protein n=1 Tax=Halobacillus ihumii TaxID=2686092 RepID=UPI0013D77AA6|nr:alanine-zipper protein [Halobacillus ihumii]